MRPQRGLSAKHLGNGLCAGGRGCVLANNDNAPVDLAPGNPRAYFSLAQAHEVAGDLSSAEQVYRSALKTMPDSIEIKVALAGIKERQKAFDEAMRLYEEVLQQQPDNAVANNACGCVCFCSSIKPFKSTFGIKLT